MTDCTINLLNPLSNALAENIRAYRRLRGKMSQGTLAVRAGMSLRGIQDIEYGDSWPSAETIEAIAKALEIPSQALFVETKNVQLPSIPATDLLRKLGALTDDELAAVLDVAEAIVKKRPK